jgi:hypothetical protein
MTTELIAAMRFAFWVIRWIVVRQPMGLPRKNGDLDQHIMQLQMSKPFVE